MANEILYQCSNCGKTEQTRAIGTPEQCAAGVALMQKQEQGLVVELPTEIRGGDKVGEWLIAGVDFGSKMEQVEAFHLIRETYRDEYAESTRAEAENAIREGV